jgi:hypothetical protein
MRAICRRQWLVLQQLSLRADTLDAAGLVKVIGCLEGMEMGDLPESLTCKTQIRNNRFGPTSGKAVMALVNALQNNSTETFHQEAGGPASRLMKIRSIWPFPVKGSQVSEDADTELPHDDADESGTPSSFVT